MFSFYTYFVLFVLSFLHTHPVRDSEPCWPPIRHTDVCRVYTSIIHHFTKELQILPFFCQPYHMSQCFGPNFSNSYLNVLDPTFPIAILWKTNQNYKIIHMKFCSTDDYIRKTNQSYKIINIKLCSTDDWINLKVWHKCFTYLKMCSIAFYKIHLDDWII